MRTEVEEATREGENGASKGMATAPVGQHFAADPYDWLRLVPVLANGAARLANVAIATMLGGR